MSKTKFYIGQPVYDRYGARALQFFDIDMEPSDYVPALGLPNAWYPWDGGTEPPCDGDQDVIVQFKDGMVSDKRPAHLFVWGHSYSDFDIVFYMIIKAPAVIL